MGKPVTIYARQGWRQHVCQVCDVHEAKNSSHDAKQMGESSLTRVQIPTELLLATMHPRTDSSIIRGKFTLMKICRILPRTSCLTHQIRVV